MSWDWWEYYRQPPEFIHDILEHIKAETEIASDQRRADARARANGARGR